MEENLAGYLLDNLDPATRDQVIRYLDEHPEAHQHIDSLRQTLDLLALDCEEIHPPRGLKYATLSRIAEYRCRTLPKAPRPSPSQGASRRTWWRRSDVAIAAILLLAVSGLGLPTIAKLWHQEQITACKDNLRRWHMALIGYSDTHHGDFPRIEHDPPLNFAGAYAPILRDSELLPVNISVGCPSNGEHGPLALTVEELAEMQSSPEKRAQYEQFTRKLGGCYAYSLGYQELVDGKPVHFGLRRDLGDDIPIMSDRPPFSDGICSLANSPNHGGSGQNVLYIGGNVRYVSTRNVGLDGDDIFANRQNKMAVGLGMSDTVLGPSGAHPYPNVDNP